MKQEKKQDSKQPETQRKKDEEEIDNVDQQSEDSFPASDPPSRNGHI